MDPFRGSDAGRIIGIEPLSRQADRLTNEDHEQWGVVWRIRHVVMVGNLCWFCYVGSRINGFDRSAQL